MPDPKPLNQVLPKIMPESKNEFTLDEMIACVEREITHRKGVYKRLVEKGDMQPAEARYQLDCMRAVWANLKSQQPNLFNQE